MITDIYWELPMCVMSNFVGRKKLSIPAKGKLFFPTHYIHREHFWDQMCVFLTPTNSLIQTQCPTIQFIGRADIAGPPCIFIGRTDAEVEAPILWPPDAKSWLIRKDPDAGKDWWQEKGMTEDEMFGWHHRLHEDEFEQALGDGEGQGGLACCSLWCRKESDRTELLNNSNISAWWIINSFSSFSPLSREWRVGLKLPSF